MRPIHELNREAQEELEEFYLYLIDGGKRKWGSFEQWQRRFDIDRCIVCRSNFVDVEAGFDTCESCLKRI